MQGVPSDPEASRASAGEFARTWVETLNEAYGTLDTTALRAMSAPECVTCQAYINSLNEAKAAGRQWRGGKRTVRGVEVAPLQDQATQVLITYNSTDFYVLEPTGQRVSAQPGRSNAVIQVGIKRADASWAVTEVARP